ncbi:hypothetical protein HDV05_005375 [Chytridiales sp. JEL 0842]|nr:hypothetical protein HDV05_005375 [Chytridiales sp. JEL 0842]
MDGSTSSPTTFTNSPPSSQPQTITEATTPTTPSPWPHAHHDQPPSPDHSEYGSGNMTDASAKQTAIQGGVVHFAVSSSNSSSEADDLTTTASSSTSMTTITRKPSQVSFASFATTSNSLVSSINYQAAPPPDLQRSSAAPQTPLLPTLQQSGVDHIDATSTSPSRTYPTRPDLPATHPRHIHPTSRQLTASSVVVESLLRSVEPQDADTTSFWEDLMTFLRYWGIIAKDKSDANRINYITGLKGLACLAVFNIFGKDFNTARGMEVFGTGWLAVPLFFLISGRLNTLRLTKTLDFSTVKSVFLRRTIRFIWVLTGASLLFWYLCTNEFYGRVDLPTRNVGFLALQNQTEAVYITNAFNDILTTKIDFNSTMDPPFGLLELEVNRSPTFWGAFKQPINLLARNIQMTYPGPYSKSSGFWTMTIDLRNSYFLYFLIPIIKTYPNFKWPILWALLVTFYMFQCWTGVFVAGYMIAEIKPLLGSLDKVWKRIATVGLMGLLVALFFVSDEQFDRYNNYILIDTWSGDFHPKDPIPFQVFQYRGFWGAVCVLLVAEMSEFIQGLLSVKPLMFVGKVSVGVYVLGPLVLSTFRPWLSKILFPTIANSILRGNPSKVPFLEGWLVYLLSLGLTLLCAFLFKVTFDNHSFKIAEWAEWILDGGDEPPEHQNAPQELEKGHAYYLNGMRGIASVGVFTKHSSALLRGPSLEVLGQNAFNVPLFFVLSGRVVGLQIAKRGDIKTLAGNALRRPFRLTLPVVYAQILYWFLLTYTKVFTYSDEAAKRIAGYYPLGSNRGDDAGYNLTFVGAVTQPLIMYINGTAPQYPLNMQWTLPHELVNAYAIFLCAVIAVLYKRRQWVLLIPVCITAYLYQVWLAAFLLGFFMSQYMSYMKKWNIYYRHLAGLGFLGIIILNTTWGEASFNKINNEITINQDGGIGYILDKYPLFWQFDPRGIFNAWALVHMVELMEILQWAFTRKPIMFLGRVSYGVYLVHPIVLASFRSWLFVQWTPADRDPLDITVPAQLGWSIFCISMLVTIFTGYWLHKTADFHSVIFSKWLERVMLGEKDAVDFTLKKEREKMYNWFFDPFSVKKKWAKEVEKWGKVKKAWADTREYVGKIIEGRRKKKGGAGGEVETSVEEGEVVVAEVDVVGSASEAQQPLMAEAQESQEGATRPVTTV